MKRLLALCLLALANPLFGQQCLYWTNWAGGTFLPWTAYGTATIATNTASITATNNYAILNYTAQSSWSNYTVQCDAKCSATGANTYGPGIDLRVNTTTSARYGFWCYPEGSGGGSLVVKIVYSTTLTAWTTLATANIPSFGTNFHNLAFSAIGSTLTGYLDGKKVITASDSNLTSGTIGLNAYSGGKGSPVFQYQNIRVFNGPSAGWREGNMFFGM